MASEFTYENLAILELVNKISGMHILDENFGDEKFWDEKSCDENAMEGDLFTGKTKSTITRAVVFCKL